MATYRQNVTQSVAPAMATAPNVTALANTIAATNASDAQATANLLKLAGGTMWAAYTGKQEADLEKALKSETDSFQQTLNDIKSADTANKASVERMRTEVQGARKDYYGASILSGVDPETAKNRALQVGGTQESSVLAEYRLAQEKIMAARDAMPQRQHEFMQRSETILKEYIAKLPGMANNFRQIAEEVTGKRGLDLYSVNRLYEDVNFIERKNQEAQKQQQEMQAKMMTAYVNDRKSGGVSETQAIAEYQGLDTSSRMELANLAVAKNNAKANAEASMKVGGEKLQNYITYKAAEFDTTIMEAQGAVFAQLSKLGISKTQIMTGTIPDHIKSNPEYVKIMDSAGTQILNILEAQYKSANADVEKQLLNNVIDSGMARTAKKDLDTWYADKQKFYTENKNSPLLAFVGNDDPTKVAQQRLTLINTFSQTLQLPPDVVMELMSVDEKTFNTTATRYPMAKQQLMYLRELSSAALRGVSNDEWTSLLKKVDSYKSGGITEIPKNSQDAGAALIDINKRSADLTTKVQTNQPIVFNEVFELANSAMATPANAETFFKKSDKVVDIALGKLPTEEKQALVATVNQKANSYVYGVKGFGDDAKTKLTQYVNAPLSEQLRNVANPPTFVFKDATGNSALSMTKEMTPKANLNDVQMRMFETYKKTGLGGDDLNKRLAHIDSVLRIQSKTTGTPINELRKNFIMTFNQAGMPSDVATKDFVNAANTTTDTGKYGLRNDGTAKGSGWLGELKIPGTNSVATEYSIGVNINGKEMEIPTIVPTLTKAELNQLLVDIKNNKQPSKAIVDKAVAFAKERVKAGKSPFAEQGDTIGTTETPTKTNTTAPVRGNDILNSLKALQGG